MTASSVTYVDGSTGLSAEETTKYSTNLLRILGRFPVGTRVSKAYCLWMIGFKQYEELNDETSISAEEIETSVQKILEGFMKFLTSSESTEQSRSRLREQLLSKYTSYSKLANRPLDQQYQFQTLLSELSCDSLIGFNKNEIWLTNQGRTLIANNVKGYTRKFFGKVYNYVAQTASELVDSETNSKGPQ